MTNSAFQATKSIIYSPVIPCRGHDPNERHELGWTPLMVAVAIGNIDLVKLLLDKGADVNAEDNFFLPNFIRDMKTLTSILRVRLSEFSSEISPKSNTKGFTALHFAALLHHLEIVKLLLERGANPLIRTASGHLAVEYVDPHSSKNGVEILKLLESAATVYALRQEQEDLELRKKFPLEMRLKDSKNYIVGQEGAIGIVAATIRRKENGWQDEDRPLVFLFLGIGKTELAKRLAEYIHKSKPEAFIRIDMSEFQTKHEVSKFIGSPPGYVGYEEGGQLTEKLRKYPNAVVLFDEVEKAHPDILTIMLQLFDEGRLTDGRGKTVVCKDAIFIMTSNLAQEEIAAHCLQLREEAQLKNVDALKNINSAEFFSTNQTDIATPALLQVSKDFRDRVVRPILISHFRRNEFLGRINEIVYFLPFSEKELEELVEKELQKWKEKVYKIIYDSLMDADHFFTTDQAKARNNLEISWTKDVNKLLTAGYDVHYGARSLKFEVDRAVVNQLAALWEQGQWCTCIKL
ncbi:hypothetical protein Zmor_012156 [Zophobas morio]|uniref:AAA+ ATPase domain-containing protein n=1 Tax=Zophobas morio TaxID=2755281 RepID=A0AA38LZ09_9CUCU|nr:hypothetical protein Zmor_012156 [Zophobas morio]